MVVTCPIPMFDVFLLSQNWWMLMRMAPVVFNTYIFNICNVPNLLSVSRKCLLGTCVMKGKNLVI